MLKSPLCSVPFSEINFMSAGISPCCFSKAKPLELTDAIDTNTIESSKSFQYLQNAMMSDTLPAWCDSCAKVEAVGGQSMRLRRQYPQDAGIKLLTIFLNNLCNLTCVMCSPHNSSSHTQPDGSKVTYDTQLRTKVIKRIIIENSHTLRTLIFSGGEILIDPVVFNFLNDPEMKDIFRSLDLINITTNASGVYYKKQDYLNLLREFNNVQFTISIDGSLDGSLETIRKGIVAKDFDNAARELLTIQNKLNAPTKFNFALQLGNMMDIIDTVVYIQEIASNYKIMLGNRVTCGHMSLEFMTEQQRSDAIKIIDTGIHKIHQQNLQEVMAVRELIRTLKTSVPIHLA